MLCRPGQWRVLLSADEPAVPAARASAVEEDPLQLQVRDGPHHQLARLPGRTQGRRHRQGKGTTRRYFGMV